LFRCEIQAGLVDVFDALLKCCDVFLAVLLEQVALVGAYFGECDRSFRRIVTGGLRGDFSAVSVT